MGGGPVSKRDGLLLGRSAGHRRGRPRRLLGVLLWNAPFHYAQPPGIYGRSAGDLARLLYGTRLAAVRRWLAQRFGLRFIRSPVYRLVEPRHLRAIEGFYIYAHRIFQKYV